MTAIGSSLTSRATGGVATDAARQNSRADLDRAGEQFEAIFVRMMMKSMRQANLAESLFDNKATEQFRDMQDQQFAQTMAETTPLGIGKAMTEFLARGQAVQPVAAASDGSAAAKDDAS